MSTSELKQVSVGNLQGGGAQVFYDVFPDECPRCHTSIHPKLNGGIIIGAAGQIGSVVELAFNARRILVKNSS